MLRYRRASRGPCGLMQQLHATGGVVLLGAIAVFSLILLVLAFTRGARPWIERARTLLTALIALQAAVGALLYVTGGRPGETLHVLYGVVALAALPLASSFSSEAPPKARAGVLALGGLLTLGLLVRLLSTGD